MSVEIPSEYLPLVHDMVATGTYPSESAVVGEALRLLAEQQRRQEELRQALQIGIDELDRNEGIEVGPGGIRAFVQQICDEAFREQSTGRPSL